MATALVTHSNCSAEPGGAVEPFGVGGWRAIYHGPPASGTASVPHRTEPGAFQIRDQYANASISPLDPARTIVPGGRTGPLGKERTRPGPGSLEDDRRCEATDRRTGSLSGSAAQLVPCGLCPKHHLLASALQTPRLP
ncbi:hypothetical protein I79_004408 [Cricetulus griseus]|uniref:Uncharacterized protein n=1 Tax=Cricetulus griseus TaxID=10029 RepID=G3H2J5_CRIGR|nr:hypothetical protein I79_004408 [Cricetulus griseus]